MKKFWPIASLTFCATKPRRHVGDAARAIGHDDADRLFRIFGLGLGQAHAARATRKIAAMAARHARTLIEVRGTFDFLPIVQLLILIFWRDH